MSKTTIKSDIRYDQILQGYKNHLSKYGDISLSHYCTEHNIYYCGIKRWLNEQDISIRNMRKSHSKRNSSKIPSSVPIVSSSILPIHITNSDSETTLQTTIIPNIISKVKITYPTGVIVDIEGISMTNLLSLTQ